MPGFLSGLCEDGRTSEFGFVLNGNSIRLDFESLFGRHFSGVLCGIMIRCCGLVAWLDMAAVCNGETEMVSPALASCVIWRLVGSGSVWVLSMVVSNMMINEGKDKK